MYVCMYVCVEWPLARTNEEILYTNICTVIYCKCMAVFNSLNKFQAGSLFP